MVFAPKYRRKVIYQQIREDMGHIISELCKRKGVEASRDYIRRFNCIYSYVTQLVRLHDPELFHEYQYITHLVKLLPRPDVIDFIDVDDKIRLEYASLTETFAGAMYWMKSHQYLFQGKV